MNEMLMRQSHADEVTVSLLSRRAPRVAPTPACFPFVQHASELATSTPSPVFITFAMELS